MPADDYDDPSDIDEIREYLSDADEYDGDLPGYEGDARPDVGLRHHGRVAQGALGGRRRRWA